MIRIRKLEEKDIPFMIEWMQDDELTKNLQADFKKFANYKSQLEFIKNSITESNKNFAIIDDNDEYQGSISLKNIDLEKSEAEFAICVRKCAQGKNISFEATNEILMYAFQELGLRRVYLYVSSANERANGFYNKYGFTFEKTEKESLEIKGKMHDINWYGIEKEGFISLFKNREQEMTNVHKVTFPEITDNRGELVALEYPSQLPFDLNRIYYMYNIGEGITRGKHSHYDLEQILFAVKGEVTIYTKTPFEEKKFILNKPNEGLYIGNMIWREMSHFSSDAVLMVVASKKYDPDDYIRSYSEYEEKAKKYFVK